MLNKIKLYIGYWLIMLYFYPYRKVFAWDWFALKESFKVISHPDDYDSKTFIESYTTFLCANVELRRKVEQFKRYGL